jgi:formate transporter
MLIEAVKEDTVGYKDPKGITDAATAAGAAKAQLPAHKALVAGFMAGAFIALGGLLAVSTSAGLDPKTWGALPLLITGATFSVGLMLVVIAGSELVTGNMALIPLAVLRGRATVRDLARNWAFVLVGNLLGSLFVAYFLAVKTGVVTAPLPLARLAAIAGAKAHVETHFQVFARAVGCNWLVCLAVWMSLGAQDIGGKVLAIFFPVTAFVAIGFDHVVANMFFLPAAIFAGVDGITWADALGNWVFAFLGNVVGGAVFVATGYWYLFGREPQAAQSFQATLASDERLDPGTPALTDSIPAGAPAQAGAVEA